MHCTASLDAQLAAEEAEEAATATATVCFIRCSKHYVVSAALLEMMAVSDSLRKYIFPCPAVSDIFPERI